MSCRTSSIRIVVVIALIATVSVSPAWAECNAWECRRTVDTAECWIRYGPSARFFQQGSDCTAGPKCSWYFNEGEWDMACSYDCTVVDCYDV